MANQLEFESYPDELYKATLPAQIEIGRAKCLNQQTEHKAQFRMPAKGSKIVTREACLEKFWWHEFYEEYLKSVERRFQSHPMPNSEYADNFTKELVGGSSDELIDKFPLYGSNSITFYNQSGDKTCNFRKSYAITKPVYLQDEQFG